MENDILVDETIDFLSGISWIDCDCIVDASLCEFDFEKTFQNIYLGSFIINDPGEEIEVYSKIYNLEGLIVPLSTPDSNVYGYVNGECECTSGSCCDFSLGRPYQYKVTGSQPTGYVDYFYCAGANSPILTNYVYEKDYYCSGYSEVFNILDNYIESCGVCMGCYDENPESCQAYSTSAVCGNFDCDIYDSTCRNYHDVDLYCDGSGSCESDSWCDSFTNAPAGTYCGVNMVCDGIGNCEEECECTVGLCCDGCYFRENSYVCDDFYDILYGCPNGGGASNPGEDVYFQSKKRYCDGVSSGCSGVVSDWSSWQIQDDCTSDEYCEDGESSCFSCGYHSYSTCYDNDVYWFDYCDNLEDKRQECGILGCLFGNCVGTGAECYYNLDCGVSDYLEEQYCSDGDLYAMYGAHVCNNPGQEDAYCSYLEELRMYEDCEGFSCIDKVCAGEKYSQDLILGWNDVYFENVPINNSIENILATVIGSFDNIWSNVDGVWLSYSPTVLPEMNTLLFIEEEQNIEIDMNSEDTLEYIYYEGNLSEVNEICVSVCSSLDKFSYCYLDRAVDIEGEIIERSCYYLIENFPELKMNKCEVFHNTC